MATITEIFAEARALVSATSTSLSDATLLRRFNQAGLELNAKFVKANRAIKFDDNNNTGLPVGTFDLTSGKQDYAYGGSLLTIDRIEVKDISGLWHKVNQIDERNITEALAEYKKTAGLPDEYALRANSIFFYCPPSSSLVTCGAGSAGGKIYYSNGFKIFTTDDVTTGTKEPGIAQTNPYIFSYKMVLPYAACYKKDRVEFIMSEIARMENELIGMELNKNNDKKARLSMKIESTR